MVANFSDYFVYNPIVYDKTIEPDVENSKYYLEMFPKKSKR